MYFADSPNSEEIESYSHNLLLPNLTATQVVDSLGEWDGMENTMTLFQDLVISESGKLLVGCALPMYVDCRWSTRLHLFSDANPECWE